MASLPTRISIAGSAQKVQQIENFPNSYCFMVKVHVNESGTLEYVMRNGAPNTSAAAWEHMATMHKEFKSDVSGYVRKEILLLCFGKFMHQSRVEAFAAEAKAAYKLSDMRIRTMLAFGDDHRMFCKERGIRRIKLVSMARKVRRLDLWHVPVLHQEDRDDCVTNALALEPYEFGWSAEHVFGFERNSR